MRIKYLTFTILFPTSGQMYKFSSIKTKIIIVTTCFTGIMPVKYCSSLLFCLQKSFCNICLPAGAVLGRFLCPEFPPGLFGTAFCTLASLGSIACNGFLISISGLGRQLICSILFCSYCSMVKFTGYSIFASLLITAGFSPGKSQGYTYCNNYEVY